MQSRKWSACIRVLQWRPFKFINFSTFIEITETILGKWKWKIKKKKVSVANHFCHHWKTNMLCDESLWNIISHYPVKSASVKISNLAWRYIKNIYNNSMRECHLNNLMIFYVHRYIKLEYDKIIFCQKTFTKNTLNIA